jgi:hypothetical protein
MVLRYSFQLHEEYHTAVCEYVESAKCQYSESTTDTVVEDQKGMKLIFSKQIKAYKYIYTRFLAQSRLSRSMCVAREICPLSGLGLLSKLLPPIQNLAMARQIRGIR